MAFIFDPELAGASSNSYISVETAETLLGGLPESPGIAAWMELAELEKQQTLSASTSVLNSLNWAGRKCSCEQELQWPRLIQGCPCVTNCDSIPTPIQLATAYLAAYLGETGGFLSFEAGGQANTSGLDAFSEVQVGPLKVKLKEGYEYEQLATNLDQIPPYVADLIRPFINGVGVYQSLLNRRSVALGTGHYIGSPRYTGTMSLRTGVVYPRIGGWYSNRIR